MPHIQAGGGGTESRTHGNLKQTNTIALQQNSTFIEIIKFSFCEIVKEVLIQHCGIF